VTAAFTEAVETTRLIFALIYSDAEPADTEPHGSQRAEEEEKRPVCQNRLQITFRSLGMKILRAFLIMGCGFSSSAENLRLRGSNIS